MQRTKIAADNRLRRFYFCQKEIPALFHRQAPGSLLLFVKFGHIVQPQAPQPMAFAAAAAVDVDKAGGVKDASRLVELAREEPDRRVADDSGDARQRGGQVQVRAAPNAVVGVIGGPVVHQMESALFHLHPGVVGQAAEIVQNLPPLLGRAQVDQLHIGAVAAVGQPQIPGIGELLGAHGVEAHLLVVAAEQGDVGLLHHPLENGYPAGGSVDDIPEDIQMIPRPKADLPQHAAKPALVAVNVRHTINQRGTLLCQKIPAAVGDGNGRYHGQLSVIIPQTGAKKKRLPPFCPRRRFLIYCTQSFPTHRRQFMKLMHLSDLHLGKRVNEFSMLEDQRYILGQILELVDREGTDGVLIAGDVYDKSVPSAEAVALLDDFLVALADRGQQVLLISGNHDSAERMAFGGRLMRRSGIHIAPVYDGRVEPICLEDEYGPVRVYLLPFVKPAHIRRFFFDEPIESYTDALRTAVQAMDPDTSLRNLLVTHQFVTGAARCDSEELSLGGTDNVDCAVFDAFDYVALGHIHSPQKVGRETMRYCGTPLKYSFSEAGQQKSVTLVQLGPKGRVTVETRPLAPLRDMAQLRGSYQQLTLREFYEGCGHRQDYLQLVLTDEEDVPDAAAKLRVIYPNLMKLSYDNQRTRAGLVLPAEQAAPPQSPLEMLEEFYRLQNGQPMSDQQRQLARDMMEKIWEGQV